MSRTWKSYLIAALAVSLIGIGWIFVNDNEEAPPEETSQAEACDSCSARHSNLSRLRDARALSAMADE